MKLLEAHSLSHAFDYPLFSDISLELNAGESIAIIGVSGSGKSTLLHILSTLLTPKEGTIQLLGEDLSGFSKQKLVEMRRHDLGMIFQSHYLFKGFSAYENLEVAGILSGEPIDEKLLERLGILKVIQQKVTELSGGQQQRISIARILTKKPRIIFADEPTGNLDLETASEVMNLFNDYLEDNGAGMILVTHDTPLAMRCDKVYRLQDEVLVQIK